MYAAQLLEKKGRDAISLPSHHIFCASTNVLDAAPVERGDRRIFALHVSSALKGDKERCDLLWDLVKDKEVVYLFYLYLMNLDLEGFDAWAELPSTEMKVNLQMDQRDHHAGFLQYLAMHPSVVGLRVGEEAPVHREELYAVYKEYAAGEHNLSGDKVTSKHKLTRQLRQYVGQLPASSKNVAMYSGNGALMFPSCNTIQEKLVGLGVWDNEQV